MKPRASVGSGDSLRDLPPAGIRASTFTASGDRRVWESEPDLFLVQGAVLPRVDRLSLPSVFDVDAIAVRRRALTAAGADTVMSMRGVAVGVAVSLPIWALILWAVWRLLGHG